MCSAVAHAIIHLIIKTTFRSSTITIIYFTEETEI